MERGEGAYRERNEGTAVTLNRLDNSGSSGRCKRDNRTFEKRDLENLNN